MSSVVSGILSSVEVSISSKAIGSGASVLSLTSSFAISIPESTISRVLSIASATFSPVSVKLSNSSPARAAVPAVAAAAAVVAVSAKSPIRLSLSASDVSGVSSGKLISFSLTASRSRLSKFSMLSSISTSGCIISDGTSSVISSAGSV